MGRVLSDDSTAFEAAHARLIDLGLLAPVGSDHAGGQLWADCDLASMVEGCFHDALDPRAIDAEARRTWAARFGREYRLPRVADDDWLGRRYWLLEAGERAGTVRLALDGLGSTWQRVSSLYVLPTARGRGTSTRMLRALVAATEAEGLGGVRLGTSWTWQKSLRFYLDRGFWIMSWKHDLQLVAAPGLPEWRFAVEGDRARFEVLRNGQEQPLLAATRDGDLLRMDPAPEWDDHELAHYAMGTFAMLLALRGWPLVASEDRWAHRWWWSDCGEPEGLAYKIGVFEEVAREQGWVVQTPTIAGLDRWQVWARGHERGLHDQLVADIETVLRARRVAVSDEQRRRLEDVDDELMLDQLLTTAVAASDFEAWFEAYEAWLRPR